MRFATILVSSFAVSLGAGCVVYTNPPPAQQPASPPPAAPPSKEAKPAEPAKAPREAANPSRVAKPGLAVGPIRPLPKLPEARPEIIEVEGKPVPIITKPVDFGESTEKPGAMLGLVYFLPDDTKKLPDFSELVPTAALYADKLDISARKFDEGFPGVDGRHEWFGIKYSGQFTVKTAGEYEFRLVSDDGATLTIDRVLVADNDGVHSVEEKRGKIRLLAGSHSIEVKYFQGPRYQIALQLFVTPPGGKEQLWSPSF